VTARDAVFRLGCRSIGITLDLIGLLVGRRSGGWPAYTPMDCPWETMSPAELQAAGGAQDGAALHDDGSLHG